MKKKKNTRCRKAKPQQIPPHPKETLGGSNSGRRTCWSDSDEPQSKFIKYDSLVDLNKNGGLKHFGSVLRVRRSVVFLVATSTDGWRLFCSGTVVDHVDKKTWMLTSATLVRKRDTQFEAYGREEIKIEVVLHNGETVGRVPRNVQFALQYPHVLTQSKFIRFFS